MPKVEYGVDQETGLNYFVFNGEKRNWVEGYDLDEQFGLQYFTYMGQKRYMCPTVWEAGVRCQRDHYDPQWIFAHAREPHTASGEAPAPQKRTKVTSLVDSRGNAMSYETQNVPRDLKNVHFKK